MGFKTTLRPIMAFDIGGTWTRFGVYNSDRTVTSVSKERTISYLENDLSLEELQLRLIDRVVNLAEQQMLRRPELISNVVISFGGALNAYSGGIYNAGPIWGKNVGSKLDLKQALSKRAPSLKWYIVNDVSAHLIWYIKHHSTISQGKTVLITISSGIGCRVFDHDNNIIPLDPMLGIQGEIGHVPISFNLGHDLYHAVCDCGGNNHLNAFCSGNALERNWVEYVSRFGGNPVYPPLEIGQPNVHILRNMLDSGEEIGRRILETITLPLAQLILNILTFDPLIRQIVFTGGLFQTLEPYYLSFLRNHIKNMGVYIMDDYDAGRIERLLQVAPEDKYAGIKGAVEYLGFAHEIEGEFEGG